MLRLAGSESADREDLDSNRSSLFARPSSHSKILLPLALPHNGQIWNHYTLRGLQSAASKQRSAIRARCNDSKFGHCAGEQGAAESLNGWRVLRISCSCSNLSLLCPRTQSQPIAAFRSPVLLLDACKASKPAAPGNL